MQHSNNKILLIGLDLSFNSTGISFCTLENNVPKIMKFYRVVFDEKITASGTQHKPKDIQNVNQIIYRMPTNINISDLLLSDDSKNDIEQLYTTIRAMICSKKINKVLAQVIDEIKPDTIICTIENYIMPSFAGPNSLKTVSGLITLQGYIRDFLIRYKITFPEINVLLHTPTPTQNKKNFSGDGKADKQKMIETFITKYDGFKLLPDVNTGKIDDVIDAYSLMVFGWKIYIKRFIK